MYLAAGSKGLTLGTQAGELVLTSSSLTIRLSVSITEGWLTAWINPRSSRHVLGALSAGDRTLSSDEKTGPGKLNYLLCLGLH